MPASKTGSWFQEGARFQDGTLQTTAADTSSIFPIVVDTEQITNTNVGHTLSFVVPASNTFFEVPIYINSRGDGAGGTTVIVTLTWTGVSGVVHTVALSVAGDVAGQAQLETFPILVQGGSTITVVTSFSSTPFHYDIATRLLFYI